MRAAVDADTLDERLRALSHEVRRKLVTACLSEAKPAGLLVELVGQAPASVSEHLKVLRKTGLLELERRGRFRMYRANAAVVEETAEALAQLTDRSGRRRARRRRRSAA